METSVVFLRASLLRIFGIDLFVTKGVTIANCWIYRHCFLFVDYMMLLLLKPGVTENIVCYFKGVTIAKFWKYRLLF